MSDRNLYARAAEGDPEAGRAVLAKLRRRHGRDLPNELARAVFPMALHEYEYEEYGRAALVLDDLAGTLQAMRGDPLTGRYPADPCPLIAWVLACADECRAASRRESSTVLRLNIDGRPLAEAMQSWVEHERARGQHEGLIGQRAWMAWPRRSEEWEREMEVSYEAIHRAEPPPRSARMTAFHALDADDDECEECGGTRTIGRDQRPCPACSR